MSQNTAQRWISGDLEPNAERAVRNEIRRLVGAPAEPLPPAPTVPDWKSPLWRWTHSYTASIESLRKIAENGKWHLIDDVLPILQRLARWNEDDWKRMHDVNLDHWTTGIERAVEATQHRWKAELAKAAAGHREPPSRFAAIEMNGEDDE